MGQKQVSVIMGIYNCAPYLQESLDSLFRQTFQDFEIILCDDGSSDETYAIAQENAESHDNVILLKNESNQGLNKTLNNCLAVANGKYIARMDGDDVCDPTRFEKEVKFLEEHSEYAIVSTPMIFFDEMGEFYRGHGDYSPQKKDFIGRTPINHAPCMVRKEAYLDVGGYSEDTKLLRVEDYHLWVKMYEKGYKAYILPECLYSMRDDRNATRRRKSLLNMRNCMYAQYLACRKLHLSIKGYIYIFKPMVSYIMPYFMYDYFHKKLMFEHKDGVKY